MIPRICGHGRRPSGGVARSSLAFAARVACALSLAACGAGDDSLSSAVLSRDGGALADATTDAHPEETGGRDATLSDVGSAADVGSDAEAAAPAPSGNPSATFSSTLVDFPNVLCSGSANQTLEITNTRDGTLAVTATTTGSTFSLVGPQSLSLGPGATGMLKILATVPGSATAGTRLTGTLSLFTNDHAQTSIAIPLSAMPTGATVTFAPASPTEAAFGTTPPATSASPIAFLLKNTGNADAIVSIAPPTDSEFSLAGSSDAGVAVTLAAGATKTISAGFMPRAPTGDAGAAGAGSNLGASATSSVTITGSTCGTNVQALSFSGAAGHGQITGWPAAIDFGASACGGSAPPAQYIILRNSGSADAHVTTASIAGAPGFSTTALGQTVPLGGTLTIPVVAPAVAPVYSSASELQALSATLTIQTDADPSPQTITLTEEPQGAILTFDTATAASDFGSFGRVVVLQTASQNFSVKNSGNAPATVALSVTADGSAPSPFAASNLAFTLDANGTQTDSLSFSPTAANAASGSLALTAQGLCTPLPPPSVRLSGFGVGAGPSVVPTSIAFAAKCGGAAASPQTFTVSNQGTANMTWAMTDVTGEGAGQYSVSAVPAPGILAPGASSTVTVTPIAVPSPTPKPNAAAYAASVTITTDVPNDNPHIVSLSESPLGDQLALSVSSLRFGQIPITTQTLPQTFRVTNNANAGSPSASVSFALMGSGASAYATSPGSISNIGPDGASSATIGVTFDPASPRAYPATIALTTSDSLCAPLPVPLTLTGTGTQAKIDVSTTTLAFGTDPQDPKGLVNCGATGLAQSFAVANTGNQAFTITALSLGLKTASPYVLTGVTLPASVPIGGSATITVTPNAIPATVANPNDASPYTDTLTVTTDAAQDVPHKIALVMQARGAVIADTPLATSWDFGTLGNGLIGKFATTIKNTGNAPASVAFQGLQHPTVFGLQSSPTTVAPNGVTDVVGQFSPPQANQVWTDQGTLVVTASQAFCAPLPASWNSPVIALSGSSIAGSLPVTVSGSLAFGSTNCGSAAPASQAITLTNKTNVAYVFTARLSSGAFYTLQNPSTGDAGAGIIPGNGFVVLGVTPQTVAPGPNVVAGSAPYADDLVVTIQSQPPSGVTIPISWTLDGAMLSLPDGLGPNKDASGNGFYVADSQSGFPVSMDNMGTAAATVTFGVQPSNAFTFSPTPPITVEPSIRALPRLSSVSSDAACPALTPGSVTFLYSGPVCRPFPFSKVTVQSCVGTF